MTIACALVLSVSKDINLVPGDEITTNGDERIDFDFTRMDQTIGATHAYRLAANPKEFAGKTLRVSGIFLSRLDKDDGKRYFGCFMGEPGGCSCCAPEGVVEFVPKASYVWPTSFPPVEGRITVTGRLKMLEVGPPEQAFTIPTLVDADMSWASNREALGMR